MLMTMMMMMSSRGFS